MIDLVDWIKNISKYVGIDFKSCCQYYDAYLEDPNVSCEFIDYVKFRINGCEMSNKRYLVSLYEWDSNKYGCNHIEMFGFDINIPNGCRYITIDRYGYIESHVTRPEYDYCYGEWVGNNLSLVVGKLYDINEKHTYIKDAAKLISEVTC